MFSRCSVMFDACMFTFIAISIWHKEEVPVKEPERQSDQCCKRQIQEIVQKDSGQQNKKEQKGSTSPKAKDEIFRKKLLKMKLLHSFLRCACIIFSDLFLKGDGYFYKKAGKES